MEKRTFFAFSLSLVVFIIYSIVIAKFYPQATTSKTITSVKHIENKNSIITQDAKSSYANTTQTLNKQQEYGKKTFYIKNKYYDISMSNVGASLESIIIKGGKKPNVKLIESANNETGIFALNGNGALQDLSSSLFEYDETVNKFTAHINDTVVEKRFELQADKYAINVYIDIFNNSTISQNYFYSVTTASGIFYEDKQDVRYVEADLLNSDGNIRKISGPNFKDNNMLEQNAIQWVCLKSKYYSLITKPSFAVNTVFTKHINTTPLLGISWDDTILPGQSKQYKFLLYIGPTDAAQLEKADPSFNKALNFGMFTSIGLVLLSVLNFFNNIFHNYGVAIIVLTVCVSFLLFPLSFKSLKSMRKLQELQPQMEKLRSEYKDNPQKLNKEIMELYKKNNVNPMGGCLPMLLQMPIFFALYQTFMRSIELNGATFLWIKDLSMPDKAFILPFTVPLLGNAINVLPILMIGAMILQQKLSQGSTAIQTEQQKMMALLMPVLFGFMFYSLPSGLVLYWLINTMLTSSMQYMLLKKA